ncbi:MAG: hypothetical protein U9N86_10245 [Bacteroidota bacterium]|nr:hypothetical protein [Bacteroidota bacterium]
MNKFLKFRTIPITMILVSVLLFSNSCDENGDYFFDYSDDVGDYYWGNMATFDDNGGWLIEIDEESDVYGCSIYFPPNAVRDITVTMSIYHPDVIFEREDYPDFEPKWVLFTPDNVPFRDTVELGLSYAHLPHSNVWIMNVLQYMSDTKSYKVHPIIDHKSSAEVLYIGVLQLGAFAVFPSHK